LSLVGIAAAIWRAFQKLPNERILSGALLVPLLLLAGGVDGVVLLLVVDAVVGATLVAEHVRIER
jgi:hypothetical protein